MSTQEAIKILMKEYEEKRQELRELNKELKQLRGFGCGAELHELSNKIGNLEEFTKLF